jgi:hypothetical protein
VVAGLLSATSSFLSEKQALSGCEVNDWGTSMLLCKYVACFFRTRARRESVVVADDQTSWNKSVVEECQRVERGLVEVDINVNECKLPVADFGKTVGNPPFVESDEVKLVEIGGDDILGDGQIAGLPLIRTGIRGGVFGLRG